MGIRLDYSHLTKFTQVEDKVAFMLSAKYAAEDCALLCHELNISMLNIIAASRLIDVKSRPLSNNLIIQVDSNDVISTSMDILKVIIGIRWCAKVFDVDFEEISGFYIFFD